MDQLKLRVLICFFDLEAKDCSVTNLAQLLGEEKYTISRTMGALEKSGYLDRTNRRRPFLTKAGEQAAKRYNDRLDIALEYLLHEGIGQADAKKDAIFMALCCTDETFQRLREKEGCGRVKMMFRDGTTFGGEKLCRYWENGVYHLPFMMYTNIENGHISRWNQEFAHPGLLEIKNRIGIVQIRVSFEKRYTKFWYWDGENYRNFERNGSVLLFPAKFLRFISIGTEKGRMLHGEVQVKVQEHGAEEILSLTVFIF